MFDPPTLASGGTKQPPRLGLPGTTASGIGSAAQLVEATSYIALRVDMTAAPRRLTVLAPMQISFDDRVTASRTPLTAADFPVLAEIWDNDPDDVFDRV